MDSKRNPAGRRANSDSRIHLTPPHRQKTTRCQKISLTKRHRELRSQQMEVTRKSPNHATFRREPGIFRAETSRTDRPIHIFRPLFPRNPHFPALRSGHRLSQRPSPQKQILFFMKLRNLFVLLIAMGASAICLASPEKRFDSLGATTEQLIERFGNPTSAETSQVQEDGAGRDAKSVIDRLTFSKNGFSIYASMRGGVCAILTISGIKEGNTSWGLSEEQIQTLLANNASGSIWKERRVQVLRNLREIGWDRADGRARAVYRYDGQSLEIYSLDPAPKNPKFKRELVEDF